MIRLKFDAVIQNRVDVHLNYTMRGLPPRPAPIWVYEAVFLLLHPSGRY